MVCVSDYVIERIALEGVRHIFMVSGGGAMYLIDSLGYRKDIKFVSNHHEQASAIAAESYQRITGNLGVALVTTGPAGTNAITGVLCAWNDSIPVLILSGQAKSTFLIGDTQLRQRGVHEANITKIVESVTKYAVTVVDKNMIGYHLDKAIFLAKNGRPGPVWVDIPLDIQGAMIEPADLVKFEPEKEFPDLLAKKAIQEISMVVEWIKQAKRPIILAGHGIKLARLQDKFLDLVEGTNIPIVTSKNGFDIIYDAHPLLAGRVGTYGQRSGNFAVQNADLLISLGCRLAFPVVGYETLLFARKAKRIVVDIDAKQLEHSLITIDLPIQADLRDFINQLTAALDDMTLPDFGPWLEKIHHWRKIFPNVTPGMQLQKRYVNPYYFYQVLSEEMTPEDILIWDQGAAFYCSTVAFKVKKGQKAFSNGGFTPMGYGLPAAVGACFANDKKRLVCVHGDGGLQLNVQELQTIHHHQLPIKLFVFNNEGYLSIKHTQQQYFGGHFVGSDPKSGLSCPDTLKLAEGYGLDAVRIENHLTIRETIRKVLDTEGPYVVEVILDPLQPIEPRVQSQRLPDGTMVSKPLEDMYPFLEREEFYREMIVKPID